jgi:hypothetical protein
MLEIPTCQHIHFINSSHSNVLTVFQTCRAVVASANSLSKYPPTTDVSIYIRCFMVFFSHKGTQNILFHCPAFQAGDLFYVPPQVKTCGYENPANRHRNSVSNFFIPLYPSPLTLSPPLAFLFFQIICVSLQVK